MCKIVILIKFLQILFVLNSNLNMATETTLLQHAIIEICKHSAVGHLGGQCKPPRPRAIYAFHPDRIRIFKANN